MFGQKVELGIDITGTHLHKIDEAPVGLGGRFLLNLTKAIALDMEAFKYSGKTSFLAGSKAGVRFRQAGVFGKARFGLWHFNGTYFAADLGGVLEYYPASHWIVRIDVGDTVIFYDQPRLGTVHNFQPAIGAGYRF